MMSIDDNYSQRAVNRFIGLYVMNSSISNRAKITIPILMLGMLFFAGFVNAQSATPEDAILVDTVELSPISDEEEVLETAPTEQIEPQNSTSITEYSVSGHVYKVKVSPVIGLPYYLEDTEGKGQIGDKENSIYQDVDTPKWELLSW